MTEEGWRLALCAAATSAAGGDLAHLNLLAKLLAEQDQAKQALRDIGYGCTGTPWLDVVDEIRQDSSGW